MTVIASLSVGHCTVLVGDAAISSNRRHNTHFRVPTTGEANPHMDETGGVFRLAQKVIIVTPKCAIAWAGVAKDAQVLVEDLRTADRNGLLNPTSLAEYVATNAYQLPKTAFVIRLVDEDGCVHTASHRMDVRELPLYGKVYLAGEKPGRTEILDFLGTAEMPDAKISDEVTKHNQLRDMIDANDGEAVGLLMTGAMLWAESITGKALQERYGGAYEVAYVKDGRFYKADNVAFVFSTIDIKSSEFRDVRLKHPSSVALVRARRVWWTKYFGKRIRITTIDWKGKDTSRIVRRATNDFGEYGEEPYQDDNASPEFDGAVARAPWLCWHIAIVRGDELVAVLPAVVSHKAEPRTQRNSEMLIIHGDGTLYFSFNNNLVTSVLTDAKRIEQEHRKKWNAGK